MSDPARDYSVGPAPEKPSIEEFRAFMSMHLNAAMEAIPDSVPFGMMDPVAQPMQDELQQIEDYLYELDVVERRRQDREDTRERKVQAKRRDPSVEEVVTNIDHHVQKAVEVLGITPYRAPMLDGLTTSALVRAMLRVLDKFPPEAFAEQWWEWQHDPRVAEMGAVLRNGAARSGQRPSVSAKASER